MGNKLKGKVALVTGASKGIGAGIARALAAEGASVVVNFASSREGADKVVSEIAAAGGKAVAVGADVSKAAQAKALVAAAVEHFGQLDIVVNNSGVYDFAPLEAVTEDHFHRQVDINVLGLILVTQAALPHLKEGSSIVNMSSAVTRITPANSGVYSATKGAVDALTGVWARELGARKIRVNAINPGLIETEGTRTFGAIGSEMETHFVAQTPLGRTGQVDDIATIAVFLASDDAKWLTGETLVASGGMR
jgi:3-oxoacyl-[acyl-carrier protein] reductase